MLLFVAPTQVSSAQICLSSADKQLQAEETAPREQNNQEEDSTVPEEVEMSEAVVRQDLLDEFDTLGDFEDGPVTNGTEAEVPGSEVMQSGGDTDRSLYDNGEITNGIQENGMVEENGLQDDMCRQQVRIIQ